MNLNKKTYIIKCGGSVLTCKTQLQNMMSDISVLHTLGARIILIHGGGPEISQMCKQLDIQTQFLHGYRVTDAATMEVAQMVLVGKTNRELVMALNQLNVKAVGLSGQDAAFLKVKQLDASLGFVGQIVSIDLTLIRLLLENNYLPIIAPIGVDEHGRAFNINADIAASEIAAAFCEKKWEQTFEFVAPELIMLSDVNGLYADKNDSTTTISSISTDVIQSWLEEKKIEGGMIPKLEGCVLAMQKGVEQVHILDGRAPHSLLSAILKGDKLGTKITKKESQTDAKQF